MQQFIECAGMKKNFPTLNNQHPRLNIVKIRVKHKERQAQSVSRELPVGLTGSVKLVFSVKLMIRRQHFSANTPLAITN